LLIVPPFFRSLCPYVHPNEKARRRDPRLFEYEPLPCPDDKKVRHAGFSVGAFVALVGFWPRYLAWLLVGFRLLLLLLHEPAVPYLTTRSSFV
jgi:hypothetical protein